MACNKNMNLVKYNYTDMIPSSLANPTNIKKDPITIDIEHTPNYPKLLPNQSTENRNRRSKPGTSNQDKHRNSIKDNNLLTSKYGLKQANEMSQYPQKSQEKVRSDELDNYSFANSEIDSKNKSKQQQTTESKVKDGSLLDRQSNIKNQLQGLKPEEQQSNIQELSNNVNQNVSKLQNCLDNNVCDKKPKDKTLIDIKEEKTDNQTPQDLYKLNQAKSIDPTKFLTEHLSNVLGVSICSIGIPKIRKPKEKNLEEIGENGNIILKINTMEADGFEIEQEVEMPVTTKDLENVDVETPETLSKASTDTEELNLRESKRKRECLNGTTWDPLPELEDKKFQACRQAEKIMNLKLDKLFKKYNIDIDVLDVLKDFEKTKCHMAYFSFHSVDDLEGQIKSAVNEKEKIYCFQRKLEEFSEQIIQIQKIIESVISRLDRQDCRLDKYLDRITMAFRAQKRAQGCPCCKNKAHTFQQGKEGFQQRQNELSHKKHEHKNPKFSNNRNTGHSTGNKLVVSTSLDKDKLLVNHNKTIKNLYGKDKNSIDSVGPWENINEGSYDKNSANHYNNDLNKLLEDNTNDSKKKTVLNKITDYQKNQNSKNFKIDIDKGLSKTLPPVISDTKKDNTQDYLHNVKDHQQKKSASIDKDSQNQKEKSISKFQFRTEPVEPDFKPEDLKVRRFRTSNRERYEDSLNRYGNNEFLKHKGINYSLDMSEISAKSTQKTYTPMMKLTDNILDQKGKPKYGKALIFNKTPKDIEHLIISAYNASIKSGNKMLRSKNLMTIPDRQATLPSKRLLTESKWSHKGKKDPEANIEKTGDIRVQGASLNNSIDSQNIPIKKINNFLIRPVSGSNIKNSSGSRRNHTEIGVAGRLGLIDENRVQLENKFKDDVKGEQNFQDFLKECGVKLIDENYSGEGAIQAYTSDKYDNIGGIIDAYRNKYNSKTI